MPYLLNVVLKFFNSAKLEKQHKRRRQSKSSTVDQKIMMQQFHLFWDGLVILSGMRGLPWLGRESVWVSFYKMSVFPEVRSAVIASSSPQRWEKVSSLGIWGQSNTQHLRLEKRDLSLPEHFTREQNEQAAHVAGSLSGRKRIRWPWFP